MKKTKKRKTTRKKASSKKKPAKKAASKRTSLRQKKALKKRRIRGKSENVGALAFEPQGLGARSAGQSGDLQGLSGIEGADSESVEELLEEGNAFEAEVVKGVQDATLVDESEVMTHEVPEDDVPGEYLEEK
ncbi:MAG TPA: hypothetical protein VEW05_13810 [Candidatus Polarisedimenticolia bacterium]|nr:hypothetical protein [Candidatus Polarisedimenticolia bacterium]